MTVTLAKWTLASSRVGIAHGIIYHLPCKLITNCLLIYVAIYSDGGQ